eukprot:7668052-Lingulodinium_polyedra.AAC.1
MLVQAAGGSVSRAVVCFAAWRRGQVNPAMSAGSTLRAAVPRRCRARLRSAARAPARPPRLARLLPA